MRRVNMLDLSEQYNTMRDEVLETVDEVLSSSRYILGDNVQKLEADVAKYSNTTQGVGVGNGSDAIHIALQAAGVEAGDEVITVSFTFFATAGEIARANATPVFVDIDPVKFNMDPALIEAAITDKTKAIIPVHLYGQMADMKQIMVIAKDRKITRLNSSHVAISYAVLCLNI